MKHPALHINPDLDITALVTEFQRDGAIRIRDILTAESAQAVLHCMDNDVPWRVMYYNHLGSGSNVVGRIFPQQWEAMSAAQKQTLIKRVNEETGKNFIISMKIIFRGDSSFCLWQMLSW